MRNGQIDVEHAIPHLGASFNARNDGIFQNCHFGWVLRLSGGVKCDHCPKWLREIREVTGIGEGEQLA